MTSNFQGADSIARVAGIMESRAGVTEVPATYAHFTYDFTNYNGSNFEIDVDGLGAQSYSGTPNLAPAVPFVFTGWTAVTAGQLVTWTCDTTGPGHYQTAIEVSGAVLQGSFAGGSDLIPYEPSSDGFVVDAPLWPGLREVSIACSGDGLLRGADKTISLMDVGREIYSLWGYTIKDLKLIEVGRESIVNCCNAAMQLIYSHADRLDYFNREQTTISVTTSGAAALPANVQRIQGPARIGSAPLRTLASRAEYDHFAALYVGDSSLAAPIAFYVEPTRASSGDSVGLTLNLAPVPTGTVSVVLDVTLEPPRYDIVDLMQATVLQLPHKWAETIFMPLVRKWACSDSMMGATRRTAVMAQIDEQYAAAKQMLGLADIEPPAQSKAKPEKGGAPA